jgi:hypothetical protein
MIRVTGAVALCAWVALSTEAYAYLDPGSGSMMLQILLASVLGGLYAVRAYWRRVRSRLRRQREEPAPTDGHD